MLFVSFSFPCPVSLSLSLSFPYVGKVKFPCPRSRPLLLSPFLFKRARILPGGSFLSLSLSLYSLFKRMARAREVLEPGKRADVATSASNSLQQKIMNDGRESERVSRFSSLSPASPLARLHFHAFQYTPRFGSTSFGIIPTGPDGMEVGSAQVWFAAEFTSPVVATQSIQPSFLTF